MEVNQFAGSIHVNSEIHLPAETTNLRRQVLRAKDVSAYVSGFITNRKVADLSSITAENR